MNFLRKLFGKKEKAPEGHEDATVEGAGEEEPE